MRSKLARTLLLAWVLFLAVASFVPAAAMAKGDRPGDDYIVCIIEGPDGSKIAVPIGDPRCEEGTP
ncbi:MAG: hypothetical protein HYY01_08095 [Chloroflexi bacterium]|nr:hypothetical protein [Chloroflexota bacterium]